LDIHSCFLVHLARLHHYVWKGNPKGSKRKMTPCAYNNVSIEESNILNTKSNKKLNFLTYLSHSTMWKSNTLER
jgi:hypothetical protein